MRTTIYAGWKNTSNSWHELKLSKLINLAVASPRGGDKVAPRPGTVSATWLIPRGALLIEYVGIWDWYFGLKSY